MAGILSGSGEVELVSGAAWSSQAQSVQVQDALEWASNISTFFRSRRDTTAISYNAALTFGRTTKWGLVSFKPS